MRKRAADFHRYGEFLPAGILMLVLCGVLNRGGEMEFRQGVIAVIAMMSSFGPTAALFCVVK